MGTHTLRHEPLLTCAGPGPPHLWAPWIPLPSLPPDRSLNCAGTRSPLTCACPGSPSLHHLTRTSHLRGLRTPPTSARPATPSLARAPSPARAGGQPRSRPGARGLQIRPAGKDAEPVAPKARVGDLAPRRPNTTQRPGDNEAAGGRGERRRQLATSLVPPPQPVTLARLSCARRLRIGPSRSRSGRPGNSLGRSAVLREVQAWEERRIAEGRDGGGRPIGRGWKGEGHVGGGGPRAAGGAGRGPSGCGRGVKWGCDGRVGRGRCGRGKAGVGGARRAWEGDTREGTGSTRSRLRSRLPQAAALPRPRAPLLS